MCIRDRYKRLIPGRIVGQTLSRNVEQSLRLALQTREQHIRRERRLVIFVQLNPY